MDGVVTKLEVRLGDPVDPDKPLMEIVDLNEVLAVAHVAEHQAGRMPQGTVAHVKVTAFPGESIESTLVRLGTEADRTSGTIDAIFKLTNPKNLLRSQMRAEFSIVISKREGVSAIPRTALQGDPANRFVYVEDFELKNAFVKSQVEVGQINDRAVEILGGLLPGDKVVTKGAYLLAFAGAGSISLKEALDAAHGHEHNPDGSEITPEQKRAHSNTHAHPHHDHLDTLHGHGHDEHDADWFWKATSGILFLLLLWALGRKPAEAKTQITPNRTEVG
jgi:hypothetical protein